MADEIVDPVAPVADAEPAAIEPAKPERNKGDERFGELTYRLRQAEATIAKLSQAQPEPKPVEQPALVKPTLEQSGHDEDKHREAMDRYYEELIERKAEEKALKVIEDRETKAKAATRDESFAGKLGKLSAEQKTAAMSAQVTEVMAELIKDSDVGVEVLMHLAENPDVASEIAKLPERLQARELGRLESKLEKPKAAESLEAEPKPKPVSKAPPPASKIDASEPSTPVDVTSPESDRLSDAEWAKRRNKQASRRR